MSLSLCLLVTLVPGQCPGPVRTCLAQPAFALDDTVRGPLMAYDPRPGDIFLATDQALWSRIGHAIAGGAGVHHSGLFYRKSTGEIGLLEAGPFNSLYVESSDSIQQLKRHTQVGNKVWIRRRQEPLTPEQSAALTTFAEGQVGKRFAMLRVARQVTPFRARGPLTACLGKARGADRKNWYCSELVIESLIATGLLDAAGMRPSATYPRDIFYGQSANGFLDRNMPVINAAWDPPARWTLCP